MKFKPILWKRRNLWWPTWTGWIGIMALLVIPLLGWGLIGERFLSLTKRLDAEVLIVECWIGKQGLIAAVEEFKRGDYSHIVTVGPKVKRGWESDGRSVAELAGEYLQKLGIPDQKIVIAPAADKNVNRTYEAARSAMGGLEKEKVEATAVNVFTHGTHSRRSRLVFSKVFGTNAKVGCISWLPREHKDSGYWVSTERMESFFTETLSYIFELTLNGGRGL